MSTKLKVRLRRAEGALLRLLGQVGRRGYDVLGVSARLSPDGKAFDVVVEFEPFVPLAPGKPRPVEVLPALVRKIVDVEGAELVEPGRPAAGSPGNGGAHGTEAPAARPQGEAR